MKLEAILIFSGSDNDNFCHNIEHKGMLINNFIKNDDYGRGIWKADIHIEKDLSGYSKKKTEAEIFNTLQDYYFTSIFDAKIEKVSITKYYDKP